MAINMPLARQSILLALLVGVSVTAIQVLRYFDTASIAIHVASFAILFAVAAAILLPLGIGFGRDTDPRRLPRTLRALVASGIGIAAVIGSDFLYTGTVELSEGNRFFVLAYLVLVPLFAFLGFGEVKPPDNAADPADG